MRLASARRLYSIGPSAGGTPIEPSGTRLALSRRTPSPRALPAFLFSKTMSCSLSPGKRLCGALRRRCAPFHQPGGDFISAMCRSRPISCGRTSCACARAAHTPISLTRHSWLGSPPRGQRARKRQCGTGSGSRSTRQCRACLKCMPSFRWLPCNATSANPAPARVLTIIASWAYSSRLGATSSSMVGEHASPKPWPYYFRRCIGLRSNGRADASTQPFLALQPTGCLEHTLQQTASSFDHLIGAGEQCRRHLEAKRLRGFHVDHQLVLGRRL